MGLIRLSTWVVSTLGRQSLRRPRALLAALVAIGTEHRCDLELNQLLQAVANQFRDQLPGGAAIQ